MKRLFVFLIGGLMLMTPNVKAMGEDIGYVNQNGVQLNEKEYLFISDLFYEGYQEVMTLDDYERIFYNEYVVDAEIISGTFVQDESVGIIPFATIHETGSKRLTISKVCTTDCLITIKAYWTKSPTIRSYDVIGAYIDNVNVLDTPITQAVGDNDVVASYEMVSSSSGFGVSIKLPSTGSGMTVTQYFRATGNGTIGGSYQHAKKSISLANSKKYTISRSGYGGVFLFDSTYQSYYDGMAGVELSINI